VLRRRARRNPAIMTEAQVLADVHGYTGAGRYTFGDHARKQIRRRGGTPNDIRQALLNCTHATPADDGCWKVTGKDCDGDDLSLIVRLCPEVFVVTTY
jgi:hypothetical protein